MSAATNSAGNGAANGGWDAEQTRRIVAGLKDRPGALLPVLHAIQDAFGHVPRDAVPIIAEEMNLSRAEVHGVISFYHFFRDSPPGRHTVWVCRAEACQSMGSESLAAHAVQRTGTDFHGTSPDGRYSLEPVYCLGNCACAPSVMIGQQVHGRLDPQRFDELLSSLEDSQG